MFLVLAVRQVYDESNMPRQANWFHAVVFIMAKGFFINRYDYLLRYDCLISQGLCRKDKVPC